MKTIQNISDEFLNEGDITIDEIPSIDLYMDQILTLISDKLLDNGYTQEELLTKTMINNYSKERIITPVKGKKYSKNQIVQLLCIMKLKQNLPLSSIKEVLNAVEGESIETAYDKSTQIKQEMKDKLDHMLVDNFSEEFNIESSEDVLTLALTLSSMSSYLKKVSMELITNLDEAQEDK